jgi:hypothetical protein
MLNNCIVYRATKLEKFLSKLIPYYVPFINKRKRVNIRNYFRYRYKARFMNHMTEQLKKVQATDFSKVIRDIKWDDWEWEIVN